MAGLWSDACQAEEAGPVVPEAADAGAAAPTQSAADAMTRRMTLEEQNQSNRFVITPHKPNYILPLTYNSEQSNVYEQLDDVEVKFQFSFKVPLADHLFDTHAKLAFGYTQVSFWQAYNKQISSPFRESNYEPELMLTLPVAFELFGFSHRLLTLGLVHQSNGRSQPLSRSWNRFYADFVFERGNFYLSVKPWYRFPESAKSDPLDPRGDDNPDIQDYMGHGEVLGVYLLGRHSLSLMLRNNLQSDNHGAIQLDWSFALGGKLRGYVQYFNGYGESLIDYNHRSNRIGIGVMLSDWL
jgi:phospholipase A1